MFIPDPDLDFLPIPDAGVKKVKGTDRPYLHQEVDDIS
jgi:hypothetical protein